MKRRARLISWILVGIASIVGIIWWQNYELGKGLRTMRMDRAGEVLTAALSTQVLATGADGSDLNATGPLLEQYRKDPTLTHKRYLLVTTWVHASQMFKAIDNSPLSEGAIVSSESVGSVPPEDRVDGWGNPYCLLVGPKRVTFLSGGGGGLKCDNLRSIAEQAASRATDSRLSKEGDFLVAVYERTRDDSTSRQK
jgi:hypothetical protein